MAPEITAPESNGDSRFTVRELREAQALLAQRKQILARALRAEGFAAVRLHDNFYRHPETHYPVEGDPDLPLAEIQFLACLFMEEAAMQPGARVAILRRYMDPVAWVYRLERQPYSALPENWQARFEKRLQIELRRPRGDAQR